MNTMTLDCAGLNCPLPILRLSKAVNGMTSGGRVEMIATDPGAVKDVTAWAKQTGNNLLESKEAEGKFRFVIVKK